MTPTSDAWAWLTYNDMVAIVAGDLAEHLDADTVDNLLWEHTPFPIGGPTTVYRRLATIFARPLSELRGLYE